jgi:antitoxin VapB
VRIEKIGEDLWVHPERSRDADLGQWLQHFFATTEPLPESFLADREGGVRWRA